MGTPYHSQIRKKLRTILNVTLSKLSAPQNSSKIDPKSIQKILLIRVNYRIGNILFMTPLINALVKKLPHAKIDMVVGAEFTKPIIKNMPNVENVYPLPRELTKNPIKLFKEIQKINKNNYDLVINPSIGSVSTNIATLLLKSNIKLGFYKEDTWLPINRSLQRPIDINHEALKPLALMEIFDGKKLEYDRFLDIKLSPIEKEEGKKIINDLIKNQNNKKIVTLFRDARGDKKIEKSWWKTFVMEIKKNDKNIVFIDILSPDVKEPLFDDIITFSSKNLRNLAKTLSASDAFICGDTGPMHLASASLTPTIALFNETDPKNYGPLGKRDKAIEINNKNILQIAKECQEHLTMLNNTKEKQS